jgi:para-aminobenzoate synthetase component 1
MDITEFKTTINNWGQNRVPFLFAIDFEMKRPLAFKLEGMKSEGILYQVNDNTNSNDSIHKSKLVQFEKHPISFSDYNSKFEKVKYHLSYGDTFLTNLTIKTEIRSKLNLRELFISSSAKYKLWKKDKFLVFSPETFIKINRKKISSFPMKGTIDAGLPSAADILLNDRKELSEHVTIVDLIRNDLSHVASNVHVKRFRYLEEIRTNSKNLLQASSEIVGDLPDDYAANIGDIVTRLLPAGSVSGAPKPKTLEIISDAEQEERGYYTGVFGLFDGANLDSAVMIRFIEQVGNRFYYRSGGGITSQSDPELEYEEAINKVYLPSS